MRNIRKRLFALASVLHPIRLPNRILNRNGEILLHVGDIPIWDFPRMMRLIKKIRPEILVHTGDMVDNLKVSRKPEEVPAYKKYAKKLIKHIEKYATETYIVPGNNDLEDFLAESVTKTRIIPANTCIEIRGLPCLLCHRVLDIDGEAKFYFYGHGPTGDTHSFSENGKYYSNVFFAPAVLFPDSEEMIQLAGFKRRNFKK
ncbi:MAG: metallophosphoesterase [Clostridia bacterium]|nr:hypothetical protein [Oscillospiraceae bacterium]MBQ7032436.1 metallophosphoesterase [Clostridia bacterium]